MSIIWYVHKKIKTLVPNSFIKRIRYFFESNFDFIWVKRYYGQFAEDAVLLSVIGKRIWDAKEDLPYKEDNGFYVDVGAYSPKQFSNTYSFYQKGWKGINIDATPGSMKIFDKVRRGDINIEAAVSDKNEELIFYSWGVPNGTNTLSKEHADTYEKIFKVKPKQVKVRTYRLDELLDKHLPAEQHIIFFSIDVENHNLEVLHSNNWSKYRPAFVIVEIDSIKPSLEEILSSDIVCFMKEQNYHLCSWVELSLFFERNNQEISYE